MPALLSSKLEWPLANPLWASTLNPLVANPMNSASILKDIALISGITIINHQLGRMMQGWFLTDINGSSTIYRSAPMNSSTLTLTSSAIVTVNIGVF